jgi:hypothetical protein
MQKELKEQRDQMINEHILKICNLEKKMVDERKFNDAKLKEERQENDKRLTSRDTNFLSTLKEIIGEFKIISQEHNKQNELLVDIKNTVDNVDKKTDYILNK